MRRLLSLICLFGIFTNCVIPGLATVLLLDNNSDDEIKVYFDEDSVYNEIYPDTLISDFSKDWLSNSFSPKSMRNDISSSSNWKSVFDGRAPQDTLSLFIFASDTLAKYSWEEVRKGYKVLARYDLSLEDLERLNFELSYPPDNRMQGIKMYPR